MTIYLIDFFSFHFVKEGLFNNKRDFYELNLDVFNKCHASSLTGLVTLLVMMDGGPISLIFLIISFIIFHFRGLQVYDKKLKQFKKYPIFQSLCKIPRAKISSQNFQSSIELQSASGAYPILSENRNQNFFTKDNCPSQT